MPNYSDVDIHNTPKAPAVGNNGDIWVEPGTGIVRTWVNGVWGTTNAGVTLDTPQTITGVKSGPFRDWGGSTYNVKAAQAGAVGDGVTANDVAFGRVIAAIPDDGLTYKVEFPPGVYVCNPGNIDWPNVLLEGNGIDTQIVAGVAMTYLFRLRTPSGSSHIYHNTGARGLYFEGSVGRLPTDYLLEVGYYGGVDPPPLDFVVDRVWCNNSGGDGCRVYSGKGIVRWSFFENNAHTGLGLNYSHKANAVFQGVSPITSSVVTENFFQGNGQDFAAYATMLEVAQNRFGDGQSNPWNMFFDQCTAVDLHDNIWHNAMLAGNNLYPLISILDSTAGTLTRDPSLSYKIQSNILIAFVNKPTYFISVDTPGGGYQPVPKYVQWNSGPTMGTAFVNTPANFELIETNDFDNLRGFGVTTPAVPATTTAYKNVTGHRILITFLTVNAATYTITDLQANVGPAMTAIAGGTTELLPGESITPTYTTLTWKFYAK